MRATKILRVDPPDLLELEASRKWVLCLEEQQSVVRKAGTGSSHLVDRSPNSRRFVPPGEQELWAHEHQDWVLVHMFPRHSRKKAGRVCVTVAFYLL